MKKLVCLLKAIMSGDMNIFKIKANKTKKGSNKLIILLLVLTMLVVSFTYAYMIIEPLKSTNMSYVMLELFAIAISIFALLECIYKSQGILFEAKDNNLLFSMPIQKKTIITARLIKLLAFEYIFDLLFFGPAIIIYASVEHPTLQYWISSIVMLLVLPIFPTIVGSALGYIIKVLSNKFKKRKIIQTIVTLTFTVAVMFLSFNLQSFLLSLGDNAGKLDNIFSKVYYPIKLYVSLIREFNVKDLAILILSNVIIFIAFIKLFSISYFKVISKSSEISKNKKYNLKIKSKTQLSALVYKDLKRFLASPIYISNAGFGLVILIIITGCVCINLEGTIGFITNSMKIAENVNMQDIIKYIPMGFLFVLLFVIPLSMISAAAISIEGKSFQFTKTLPVSGKKILLSKVLMSDIIILVPTILCTLIMSIRFKFDIVTIMQILVISVVLANFTSTFGLIVNLMYPKMDAKNDTEAVKQSASTFIASLSGLLICGIGIGLWPVLNSIISFSLYVYIMIGIFTILNMINYNILTRYGAKRIYKI